MSLVAEGALAPGSDQPGVDDLLPLAVSRPRDAFTRAREIIAGRPGPHEASVAHQAAGIVLRDIGDVNAGVRELQAALRLARRTGSAEREADVLGSLGTALVHTGRTAAYSNSSAGNTATSAAVAKRRCPAWTSAFPHAP